MDNLFVDWLILFLQEAKALESMTDDSGLWSQSPQYTAQCSAHALCATLHYPLNISNACSPIMACEKYIVGHQ